MKKKLIVLSSFVFGLAPVVALAQIAPVAGTTSTCTVGNNNSIFGVICQIGSILNAVVPVIIALGVVYFVWGVISYVIAGDEEAKKKGRDRIIYGIIGLAVIVAVWGLVKILTNTFGVNNSGTVTLPSFPTPNGN